MADEDIGIEATCANCGEIFRFSAKDELKLVKCPHCQTETALGGRSLESILVKSAMYCSLVFYCVGVVFAIIGTIVIAGSLLLYVMTTPGGHYILYYGGFLAGLMYLLKKACSMRAARMSRIGCLDAMGPGIQGTSSTGVEGQVRMESRSKEVETSTRQEFEFEFEARPRDKIELLD